VLSYPGSDSGNQGNLGYSSILGSGLCGLGGIQGNLSGVRSNLGVPGNIASNLYGVPANWAGRRR
jgi:hypothetical protein